MLNKETSFWGYVRHRPPISLMSDDQEKPGAGSETRLPSFTADGREFMVVSCPNPSLTEYDQLTTSEKAVARAVIDGLSNAEIAQRRDRSPRTIANQVKTIFRKLGVSSRAELVGELTGEAVAETSDDQGV